MADASYPDDLLYHAELQIDVRGKRRPARIESKPLYRKESD